MTLREQIEDIGRRTINPRFVEAIEFPGLVRSLAEVAFHEKWPEGPDTRAVRRALDLLKSPGWVTDQEPAVE